MKLECELIWHVLEIESALMDRCGARWQLKAGKMKGWPKLEFHGGGQGEMTAPEELRRFRPSIESRQ